VFIGLGIVLLFILGIIVIEIVNHYTISRVDISEGLAIIQTQENADIQNIETKIANIENLDVNNGSTQDNRSMKEVFNTSVIMGDSSTSAFIDYDLLNSSSVVSNIGASLSDMDAEIQQVIELNPQMLFLSYGTNELLNNQGNVNQFIDYFEQFLLKLRNQLPNTKIFVVSILPATQAAIQQNPALAQIPAANEALHNLCDRRQVAFVDLTDLVSISLYAEDGIHFKQPLYESWLQHLKVVAAL